MSDGAGFIADGDSFQTYDDPLEMHRQAHLRMQMHAADLRQRIKVLFGNLNEEDAFTLYQIFITLNPVNVSTSGSYAAGQLATILDIKYDVCSHCGKKNHGISDQLEDEFGNFNGETDSQAEGIQD
jgi:hypothetical protein